jgi:hypothetical protein
LKDCFNQVRDNVVSTVNSWSEERKKDAYNALDGGKAILTTQDHLDRYLFAFGNMHKAKLFHAISTITDLEALNGNNIELIDYGSGQGIGSIALLDYLFNLTKGETITINDISLIEPSEIALNQASKYLNQCFSGFNIKLINKTIELLDKGDLITNEEAIKFHIFSNILDVNTFSLSELYDSISQTQVGQNYFICVSPDYYSGNCRLDEFITYFKNDTDCLVISERQGEIDNPSNPSKPWKDYEKVFKVNF